MESQRPPARVGDVRITVRSLLPLRSSHLKNAAIVSGAIYREEIGRRSLALIVIKSSRVPAQIRVAVEVINAANIRGGEWHGITEAKYLPVFRMETGVIFALGFLAHQAAQFSSVAVGLA